jgi:hypothetical protein
VEHGDAVAEAGSEAAERLRCERDLRNEHDRAAAAGERRAASLQIDLGLATSRGAAEEQVAASRLQQLRDPRDRRGLRRGQLRRLGLPREPLSGRAPLAPAHAQARSHELERPGRRRAVVAGDPEREIDERRRQLVEHALDRCCSDPWRSLDAGLHDDSARRAAAEANGDDCSLADAVRHLVGERTCDRARRDEWVDGGQQHTPRLPASPVCADDPYSCCKVLLT